MRISLSKSKQHLLFNDVEFDEFDLPVVEKRASVPIGGKLAPEKVLENALKFEWEISGEPNADGWSPICVRTGVLVETTANESVADLTTALED
jgi:hypothetical protein